MQLTVFVQHAPAGSAVTKAGANSSVGLEHDTVGVSNTGFECPVAM